MRAKILRRLFNRFGGKAASLAACLLATVSIGSAWGALSGTGTEAEPFLIQSLADLQEFRDSVNASANNNYKGKYVRLDVNIDLNNVPWTPIGNSGTTPFSCIFDGNGKIISNLYINDTTMNYAGFIGYTTDATIKSLKIHNANLTGNDYIGAIAGSAHATTTVQDCEVSGSIKLYGNHYVGGITGSGYAAVTRCKTIGDGVATSYIHAADAVANAGDGDDVGGIIGLDEGGKTEISGCYVSDVTIEGFRQVGGIAGLIQNGRPITSCTVKDVVVKCIADQNTVNKKAAKMAFGGIVGAISQTGGGSVRGCSVENVQLVSDPVGVSAARMGYISGGYYDGAEGFLIPDRLSSMISGADNTVKNVVRATEGLQAPTVPNDVIDGPVVLIIETGELTPNKEITAETTEVNYTVPVTVKDSTGTVISETDAQAIAVSVGNEDVAGITLTSVKIDDVVSKAVESVGEDATSVTAIEILVKSTEDQVSSQTLTFEVHPEAVVKVTKTVEEEQTTTESTVKLSNEDLADGATFSFKLYTGTKFADGATVRVVHRSDDSAYGTETGVATVEEDSTGCYVLITTSHFSTFEITEITPEAGKVAVNLNTGVQYETLEAAYDAATAGDTITLLADITYGADRSVPVWTKPVNINLGGHTLTTNSEVNKDASNGGYTAAAICFSIPAASAGSVTISNGKIVTAYGAGVYADDPGSTLTLSDLTIEAAKTGTQATAEYSAAVRVTSGAKVIIESGSYSGAYAVAASNSGADFEINGGTFTDDIFFSNYTTSGKTKSVTITGGTFDGGFVNPDKGTLAVSGGTFVAPVAEEYCATGYIPSTETTVVDNVTYYTVKQGSYVAQNTTTGVKYETLEAAVSASSAGDTVMLLADIDLGSHARSAHDDIVLEGITLDLNGKTICGFNNGVRYSGSNAVIKNGTFDFVSAEATPSYALSIGSYTPGAAKSTGMRLENLTVKGGINIDNADVTLTDVTINQGAGAYYCLWVDEDNNASATFVSGTINAGANATAVFGVAKAKAGTTDGTLKIQGGTVNANGEKLVLASGNHIQVSGGSFDMAVPEADCATGYIPAAQDSETGMYTVKTGSYVAQIERNGEVTKYTSAQEALDLVQSGDTLTLYAGDHGTLYIRQSKTNSLVVDVTPQEGEYGPNDLYRALANVTIKGQEGARVNQIIFETGYYAKGKSSWGTDWDRIIDSLMEIDNLKIEGVTFDLDKNTAAIKLGDNIRVTGLTVKDCTVNGTGNYGDSERLLYNTLPSNEYKSENRDSVADKIEKDDVNFTSGLKNLTITGCTFNNLYQVAQLRNLEDLTFSGNTVKGNKNQTLLINANTGDSVSVSGTVTIANNNIDGTTDDRVFRLTKVNAEVSITGNTITGYAHNEADLIKISDSGADAEYTIAGNAWSGTTSGLHVISDKYPTSDSDLVAKIGNNKYFISLAEAIAAANDGDTVTLLADISVVAQTGNTSAFKVAGKSITIDGNGKTITATGDGKGYVFWFCEDANKKLANCSLKNLTINSTGYQIDILVGGNGNYLNTLSVDNVRVTTEGEALYASDISEITATESSFTQNGKYKSGKEEPYYAAVTVGYAGVITLTDCTVSAVDGSYAVAPFPSGGTINLNTTTVTGDLFAWVGNGATATPADTVINVNSGKIAGNYGYRVSNNGNGHVAVINVNGGVFKNSPANVEGVVIKTGYQVVDNTDAETMTAYPYMVDRKLEVIAAADGTVKLSKVVDSGYTFQKQVGNGDWKPVTAMHVVENADELPDSGKTQTYKFKFVDGTTDIPVGNTVGILHVADAACGKTTIIGVPWYPLGERITVDSIVYLGNRSAGDQLMAYDDDNECYWTWTLAAGENNSLVWGEGTTVKEGVPATTAPKASEFVLQRGQGLFLTRTDVKKPIYLVGRADGTGTTPPTTLAASSANKPTWTLVAAPSTTALDLNAEGSPFTAKSENDVISLPTKGAGIKIPYTYKNGEWGTISTKTVTIGVDSYIVPFRDTEHTTIPAGTGFWYLNKGGEKSVEW